MHRQSSEHRGNYERRAISVPHTTTTPQPVYSVAGQVIGTIEDDTFIKRVKGSKHMLRKPLAWALDELVLHQLQASGVERIEYFDTETRRTYSTTVALFASKGKLFNRGYGTQVLLPLGYWSVNGQLPSLGKREPPPGSGQQLALFGGEGQP